MTKKLLKKSFNDKVYFILVYQKKCEYKQTYKGSSSYNHNNYYVFHILPQIYMEITQPSQYRYTQLQYRFAVFFEALSTYVMLAWRHTVRGKKAHVTALTQFLLENSVWTSQNL